MCSTSVLLLGLDSDTGRELLLTFHACGHVRVVLSHCGVCQPAQPCIYVHQHGFRGAENQLGDSAVVFAVETAHLNHRVTSMGR